VLTGEAMGASGDQTSQFPSYDLDRLVTGRVEGELPRFAEPADSGGVVTEGKDTVLLAAGFVALN
jgi:hypothetical protein